MLAEIKFNICFLFLFSVIIDDMFFTGVIWKGDSLIDGVPETLDMLRSKVGINRNVTTDILF